MGRLCSCFKAPAARASTPPNLTRFGSLSGSNRVCNAPSLRGKLSSNATTNAAPSNARRDHSNKANNRNSQPKDDFKNVKGEEVSMEKNIIGGDIICPSSEVEDVCPTCLEEYTPENPKIETKCYHAYHLSCIYEWKLRSEKCPICAKVLEVESLTFD